ncbi:MAG: hypothetical protein KAI18_01590 [Candidatus Aenigmarchaeota archaeon]|nr:hypothetical protein [Candidatus Aenigmarchaeota archaeon]
MGRNDFENVKAPSALYTIIFPPEMSLPIFDENPDHPGGEIFNDSEQFTVYVKINDRPAILKAKPSYNILEDRNLLCLANEKSGGNNDQFINSIGDCLMAPFLNEIGLYETELDELRKEYDLNAVSFRQNPGYKMYHDCLKDMQGILKFMTFNNLLLSDKLKEIEDAEELKFVLDSLKYDGSYPYLTSNTLIKSVELLGRCLKYHNLIFEKEE